MQIIKYVNSLLFSAVCFNSQIHLLFRSDTVIQHQLRVYHIFVCTSVEATVIYNNPFLNFVQTCGTNTSFYTTLDFLRAHVLVKLHAKQ